MTDVWASDKDFEAVYKLLDVTDEKGRGRVFLAPLFAMARK